MGEFIGYVRISVADQARAISLGAESQIADINEFFESNKDNRLSKIFIEDGASASGFVDRPVFNDVLSYLRKNRSCGLVVKNITRLSRNVADIVGLLSGDLKNRKIISLDMPDIDFGTANGFFVLLTFANFAEYERRQISERTKSALKALKNQGKRLGNPGFVSYGCSEIEKKVCGIINEMTAAGYGPSAIARSLNERGFLNRSNNPWAPGSVANLQKSLARGA